MENLHLIGVNFLDGNISNWKSLSLRELIFYKCKECMKEELYETLFAYDEDGDQQYYKSGYFLNNIIDAKYHIEVYENDEDCIFETVTLSCSSLTGDEVVWPVYKPSLYEGIKIEFDNLDLPNLNKLDVSYDSLFTEETFIAQLIKKGSNLKEIHIWNWHCTDKSLNAISDKCSSLIAIGLHIDGLRMTLSALDNLIKKCREHLKHIFILNGGDHTFSWPDLDEQYYAVKALCINNNITVGIRRFECMHKYSLIDYAKDYEKESCCALYSDLLGCITLEDLEKSKSKFS